MFGRKKKIQPIAQTPGLKITTIPAEFYAGADPTIKFKETEKTVDLNKFSGKQTLKPGEEVAFNKKTAKGNFLSKPKWWFIGLGTLFIVFVAGAAFYYWRAAVLEQKQKIVLPPPIITEEPTIVKSEEPVITEEPSPEPATTTEETIEEPVYAFETPSKLMALGPDADNDNVSDLAEEVFASDPGDPDTDDDGYSDGHELFYLYNPNGFEPQKLINAGTVREYRNNVFSYSFYYPEKMAIGAVDIQGREVLLSAITGESIAVNVFEKNYLLPLADWLSENAPPSEDLSDYADFSSRFGISGKKRNDGLVYFFETPDKVYAFFYRPGESETVNYKTALEVAARSFSIGVVEEMIPETAPALIFVEPTTETTTEENYTEEEEMEAVSEEEITEEYVED